MLEQDRAGWRFEERSSRSSQIPAPAALFSSQRCRVSWRLAAQVLQQSLRQAWQLAAASCWQQRPGFRRRLVLLAWCACATRNAQLPRNARSRVLRYIRSMRPPLRRPVPARPRPIPRPKPRSRHAPEPLLRTKRLSLRSPPQQAVSSSRFPWMRPQAQGTPEMRRQEGRTTAVAVPIQGSRFKKPATGSRRTFRFLATIKICR